MKNKKQLSAVQITESFLGDLKSWPVWLLESYEKGLKFYKDRGYTFKTRSAVLKSLYLVKINDFLLYSPNLGISKLTYSKYLKYKAVNEAIMAAESPA